MTREEINILQDIVDIYEKEDMYPLLKDKQISTIKMAIKALEQESSVEILKTEESNENGTKYLNINVSDGEVKRNPDVVRLCSDVGVLEYVKPCGDVISRSALMIALMDKGVDHIQADDLVEINQIVLELPFVKQEPKTGHWDNVSICGYRCSECGKIQYADDVNELNYCCTCGAKMVKPQESEG